MSWIMGLLMAAGVVTTALWLQQRQHYHNMLGLLKTHDAVEDATRELFELYQEALATRDPTITGNAYDASGQRGETK